MRRFLAMTGVMASWSKDPSTQVGAVITRGKFIVSQGFNGPPAKVDDTEVSRERKLLRTLHAELNAILIAKQDLTGCTLYCNLPCCAQCMAAIIQVGITTVVCLLPDPSKEFKGRWLDSCNEAETMAREAGITYYCVDPEHLDQE